MASPQLSLPAVFGALRGLLLPHSHRNRGIHLVAGSGSGKSLTLGYLALQDFLRGIPQVLFDPTGGMIDAFLLRASLVAARVPPQLREQFWDRIRYVDMSGRRGHVVPWPLQFQFPGDALQEVAGRFLRTCVAIDPQLSAAPMLGRNALNRVGSPTGIILASLGLQLNQAFDLLDAPEQWLSRLDEAERRHPETRSAAAFFRSRYLPRSPADRMRLTDSYRAKLEPLLLDPLHERMFCTATGAIDFADVVNRRQTVLLDFRGETDGDMRLFKTRWVYDTLLAFIRHRGPGAHPPLALHFDEITELTNQESLGQELFSRELDYLFNVLQRQYNLWVSAAHQQMWQLSPKAQETLLSLDTQVFGRIADDVTAEALARRYAPLDPYRVKRAENVWATSTYDDGFGGRATDHFVIDERIVDMPLDEQAFLAAKAFRSLPPFEYLVKPRFQEQLHHVTLAPILHGLWPDEHGPAIAHLRHRLAHRTVLQAGNRLPVASEDVAAAVAAPDTMEDDKVHDRDNGSHLATAYWDTWLAEDAPATP